MPAQQNSDYSGGSEFLTYEEPLRWFTFDIINFFGTLDLNVFTMQKAESTEQSADELRTGKSASMLIELDKEYGIENWYSPNG